MLSTWRSDCVSEKENQERCLWLGVMRRKRIWFFYREKIRMSRTFQLTAKNSPSASVDRRHVPNSLEFTLASTKGTPLLRRASDIASGADADSCPFAARAPTSSGHELRHGCCCVGCGDRPGCPCRPRAHGCFPCVRPQVDEEVHLPDIPKSTGAASYLT